MKKKQISTRSGKHIASATLALALAFPASYVAAEDLTFPGDPAAATDPIFSMGGSLIPQLSLSGNTVTVNGGAITGYVYGGGTNTSQDVYNNQIFINGGTTGDFVYGGAGLNGNVYNNKVTITDGTIGTGLNGYVSGGFTMQDGKVYGNQVTIDGAGVTINGYVNGGESYEGDVYDNTLIINNGDIKDAAYGGYTGATGGSSGQAYRNTMIINGGSVVSSVAGGRSEADGDVFDNILTINNGTFDAGGSVYGGRSSNGKALNNTVNVYGGTFDTHTVYGGKGDNSFGAGGEASGNTANIYGGTGIQDVFGGYSVSNQVTNNKVNIAGTATINGDAYGGYNESTATGDVSGNNLNIVGTVSGDVVGGRAGGTGAVSANSLKISGTVGGDVYGGYSRGVGDVTGNIVDFSGTFGGTVIFGGRSNNGLATDNSLIIRQNAVIGAGTQLWGGYADTAGDSFSGNTLTIESRPVMTFAEVQNFEYYNLTLPTGFAAGDTLITVGTSTYLNNQLNPSQHAKFTINTPGNTPLKNVGDYFTVISDTTMYGGAKYEGTATGLHGIGVQYEYALENQSSVAPPQALIATITGTGANPDTGGLIDAGLGSAIFLNQGADFAINKGLDAAIGAQFLDPECEPGTYKRRLFGLADYGKTKQNTGGKVDVHGLNMMMGMSLGNNNCVRPLTMAVFVEGGWGKYDSRAEIKNRQDITAKGDVSYYGAGLMGKAEQLLGKNLYAEGSLRFGRSKSEYNSHDFYVPQHLGGSLPEFDLESTYYGVHLGVGYVFDINDSVKLDTSAKYLWTHLEGDSVTLLGDRFNFDDIDSHRLQVGGRLSWVTSSGKATPYIGAKYEYEFDGKAGGSVRGFKIESSDTKGSSGLLEAGVKLHTSLERLFIDLGVNGSFGQRESIGGHVALRWDF